MGDILSKGPEWRLLPFGEGQRSGEGPVAEAAGSAICQPRDDCAQEVNDFFSLRDAFLDELGQPDEQRVEAGVKFQVYQLDKFRRLKDRGDDRRQRVSNQLLRLLRIAGLAPGAQGGQVEFQASMFGCRRAGAAEAQASGIIVDCACRDHTIPKVLGYSDLQSASPLPPGSTAAALARLVEAHSATTR